MKSKPHTMRRVRAPPSTVALSPWPEVCARKRRFRTRRVVSSMSLNHGAGRSEASPPPSRSTWISGTEIVRIPDLRVMAGVSQRQEEVAVVASAAGWRRNGGGVSGGWGDGSAGGRGAAAGWGQSVGG